MTCEEMQVSENPHRYRAIAPRAPEGQFRLDQVAPGTRTIELDLGFGRGRSLFARAEQEPGAHLVGIEVKTKWAFKVDQRRRELGIERIAVYCGDAREILSRAEPEGCVDRVFIHFPDPWWKKRHGKRKLVSAPFLDTLGRLVRSGGEIFFQTDVESRAEEYAALVSAHSLFDTSRDCFLDENPFGLLSNREVRAHADGLPVYRVLARRRSIS